MSTISASTTSTTAFKITTDTTGALVFQTGATPTTAMTLGADQSVTFAGTPTYSGGTANGVAYLNASKVLTTGTALVFDGTNLGLGITPSAWGSNHEALQIGVTGAPYASLSQQTTVNCATSLAWNATAVTGDESWVYRGSSNYASRLRQYGSGFQYQGSGVNTAPAGSSITWYTGLSYEQTTASATGAKIGVNVTNANVALQVLGPTLSSLGTQSSYAFGVGNGSGYDLVMGTDASYGYVQTFASKRLYLQNQGNDTLIGAGLLVNANGAFTTLYTKLQVNAGTDNGLTLYATDNASGSYNTSFISHRFNYTGTSQTDGARITFTRPSNADGNYGDEMYFSTRPNGGSLTEAVRVDQSQRMLQKAGRKSNAYVLGNQQMWVYASGGIANGGTLSLCTINQIYDNLCYELDIFVNRGGYFACKYAGVFGYNGFTTAISTGDTGAAALSKTGTLYNETMTITNNSGVTVNQYIFCLRVWGLNVTGSVSTGGADLVTSSYMTRIE